MKRKLRLAGVFLLPVLLIAGCSIYEWTHPAGTHNDEDILVSDGYAALDSGDYSTAVSCFQSVKNLNPKNSRARKGHAIAYAKLNGFSMVNLAAAWLGDTSYNVIPEVVYTGVTNLELRFRLNLLHGKDGTEYGEKQYESKFEIRARYSF